MCLQNNEACNDKAHSLRFKFKLKKEDTPVVKGAHICVLKREVLDMHATCISG